MVRINLIEPRKLADQHLIAEYNEILMLFGYVKKSRSKDVPDSYRLGKGHIIFFKNKLLYLKKRHEAIKKEMNARGFKTSKNIDLKEFDNKLANDWKPKDRDFEIIKQRLVWKIKNKPGYYRYYRERKEEDFLISLIEKD